MRRRPDLTPTARLCLVIAERENRPLTYPELEILTGCGRAAIEQATPKLVAKEHLALVTVNGVTAFVVPTHPAAVAQNAGGGAA